MKNLLFFIVLLVLFSCSNSRKDVDPYEKSYACFQEGGFWLKLNGLYLDSMTNCEDSKFNMYNQLFKMTADSVRFYQNKYKILFKIDSLNSLHR